MLTGFLKQLTVPILALALAGCQSQQVRRVLDPGDFWGPSTFDSSVGGDPDPAVIDAQRCAAGERVPGVC